MNIKQSFQGYNCISYVVCPRKNRDREYEAVGLVILSPNTNTLIIYDVVIIITIETMYLIHYTIQLPYQSIIFSFLLTIGILYYQYATLIYTIRVRAYM